MAKVTAKALLSSVNLNSGSTELKFTADYKDERNKEWAVYTPALSFSMTVKPEVFEKHFELGGSYTVTFESEAE